MNSESLKERMANRAYKTLPSAFKRGGGGEANSSGNRDGRAKRSTSDNHRISLRSPTAAAVSPSNAGGGGGSGNDGLFSGLHLNLGISNIISGGMNFIGQLRKKTPSSLHTPTSTSSSSTASPTSTGAFWECRSEPRSSATTANISELIEMSSFQTVPLAEGDLEKQSGRGHNFVAISSFNPTWCDLCRDLIWGLYDVGAVRCSNCHMVCHNKCRSKVQLNCTAYERRPQSPPGTPVGIESPLPGRRKSSSSSGRSSTSTESPEPSTLANLSTLRDEEATHVSKDDEDSGTLKDFNLDMLANDEPVEDDNDDDTFVDAEFTLTQTQTQTNQPQQKSIEVSTLKQMIPPDQLASAVMLYNDGFPSGQETTFDSEREVCKGFIRVILNLRRPINVLPGSNPPNVYNLTSDTATSTDRTLTSFYLPHETEKALCVNGTTTVRDVIRSLLAKFRIVDSPHKYVLYEKRPFVIQRRRSSADSEAESLVTISGTSRSRATLGRIQLRRMNEDERPLVIALNNCLNEDTRSLFVLQENDPGEICWESFSMPELKNFLLILDREEAWYKRKIHEKYEIIHEHMSQLAEEKRASEAEANETT